MYPQLVSKSKEMVQEDDLFVFRSVGLFAVGLFAVQI